MASELTEEIKRCPIQKVSIWPAKNYFLMNGVLSLVSGRYESLFIKGCMFVDFSSHNIRFFTNHNWLDYLKSPGLIIILVCDRRLASLAAFWKKQDKSINTVIYPGTGITEMKKSINACYYGLKGGEKKGVNPLTSDEVNFLELVSHGLSLGEISEKMRLGVKKIYCIKDSVRRKTGTSLNQLFSS
ncbi:LuxR family transcriptional regulator [Pantoea stewartii subsp. indologenes]|uniref:LuxR family transcriptional regulator n=2 Tax=Pantoea stewartii TaxID=66269 RepID=UPI001CF7D2DE|nr:LuxR family transcriptional regulator [Pantoea stewartii]MCU7368872.1 LuxR family transcriptional regulator [Pantoea stewartii]MDF7784604.1 LuxR family transcriptional regulator [Pantoea stewartii]MDK2632111.1 LuxR family transcriptional regulator [Pantoea stewartii subsp. indologenes]